MSGCFQNLPFDEKFDLSLLKSMSEGEIYDTPLDPEFIGDFEV